jgi:hypothetical protein
LANLYQHIRGSYLGAISEVGSASNSASGFSAGGNLFNDRIATGGHLSNFDFRGIGLGTPVSRRFFRTSAAGDATVPTKTRLAYWRMIENGSPVTEITPAYHPDSRVSQTLNVVADGTNGGWNASTGTTFYSLIDEDPTAATDTDYIWSGDQNESIRLELSDFTYTGGYNHVKAIVRARTCDSTGSASVAGAASVKVELLYQGTAVGQYAFSVSPSVTWTNYTIVFNDINVITNLTVFSLNEACSFIPKNAVASDFSIRLIGLNSGTTRRMAISALQLYCEPFTYFLDTLNTRDGTPWWPIETGYRIPWRKNKKIGFDLWFEVERNSGQTFEAFIGQGGSASSPYGGASAAVAHGTLGIRTTFMPEFDRNDLTYRIEYLNGTTRPVSDSGNPDIYTFKTASSAPALKNIVACGEVVWQGYRSTFNSGSSVIELRVNQEVPELRFENVTVNGTSRSVLRYLPEDTDHAVTNFTFYHSATLGDVWVNSQSPGGIWKHARATKFVLEAPTQVSDVNSFSPTTFTNIIDWPTEIEVRQTTLRPMIFEYDEGSGTWNPPTDGDVAVYIWGSGGAGGGGANSGLGGSGGGGGGAYSFKNITGVTTTSAFNWTVGTGGSAQPNIADGVDGDATTITGDATMTANGGGGGKTFNNGGTGGAGGTASGGTTNTSGSAGTANSGGTGGNGGNAAGGGGAGGTGGVQTNGTEGTAPGGGGGGGGGFNGVGAAGQNGRVRFEFTPA